MRWVGLAVALAGALASIGTAAAAAGPVKVHPTWRVTAARLAGDSLRFTVTVRFAPPPGASAVAACKGKVKLAEKVRPKRTAPRWTAGLAAKGACCEARINAKLPAGLRDRKVSFEVSFPGNGRVAPFAALRKLKLSVTDAPRSGGTAGAEAPAGTGATGTEAPGGGGAPGGTGSPGGGGPEGPAPAPPVIPPVPYTAADGHWQGNGLWDTGSSANVAFGVDDGVIFDINLFSSLLMRCEKKDSIPEAKLRTLHFPNAPEITLLAPAGKFSAEFTDKLENVNSDGEIPWVVRGQLGASSGTMVIEAHDANFDEHFSGSPEYTLSECHVSATLPVGKQ